MALASRLDRAVTAFEQFVVTVGFAAGTLLLFANVVARYLFDTGFQWVLETVQYLFAWVVLIGAAHGVKPGIHLGIDIVTRKFSPPVRRWLALMALMVCLAFTIPVFLLSVDYTWKVWQWGDLTLDLQIPQWIPYLAIPVGLLLMTYRLLQVGVAIWRGERLSIGQSEQAQLQAREIAE